MDNDAANGVSTDTSAINFAELLWGELEEIRELRCNRGLQPSCRSGSRENGDGRSDDRISREADGDDRGNVAPPQVPPPDEVFKTAHEMELVGLAFSGGGIRSATFNLGVLQGLAALGLLPIFDYLSTVSGGGYIGGWLESWIYRAGQDSNVAQCTPGLAAEDERPILRVQECLKSDRSNKIEHGESKAIRFLREYSNYLTPRLGFLGADLWTAIAIYIRNLLLNQCILILFLTFLLLLPYWAAKITKLIPGCPSFGRIAPYVGFLLMFLVHAGIAKNLTHLTGEDRTGEFPPSYRQGPILTYIGAPVMLFAWCISVWVCESQQWSKPWWNWCVGGVVAFSLPWSLTAFADILQITVRKPAEAIPFWNSTGTRLISVVFSLISGVAGGALLWAIVYAIPKEWLQADHSIWYVVSFGPPLLVVLFLLVVTLQLGLMGYLAPDPRREWWGRLGGWLLIMSIAWAAVFALAIYSPLAVMWSRRFLTYSSIFWVLSTLMGVIGGKSAKTGNSERTSSLSWKAAALSITPYIFIVGLAVALATVLEVVLGIFEGVPSVRQFLQGNQLSQKISSWIVWVDWNSASVSTSHAQGTITTSAVPVVSNTAYVAAHWGILRKLLDPNSNVLLEALVIVGVLCLFLAARVDLNQFSMNLFYQNRLVRCYLGASNKKRKPNPFTGFDPSDDLYISCLTSKDKYKYSGPFPIINTSLNLVKGQNLAWQERKAESFVITPLRCGFDTWLERLDLDVEGPKMRRHGIQPYGFRPTRGFAYEKGFRLGNAISISGAAASPNMGYHSVPSLAFLMTFFNVRLGAWAGNPRHDSTWTRATPRFGLFQLLAELFGLTDDEARYVYLSDGGHFENLGLYELVKRRCRYIVVCDIDCDDAYAFGDLGNAIRKCREDIGVEITISTQNLVPGNPAVKSDGVKDTRNPSDEKVSQWHWAIGWIQYSRVDPKAEDGILVYLKPSLTGDEPADIRNYHRQHPDFPHQATSDQWFSESQFESYRRLGEHVVLRLFENTPIKGRTIKEIFTDFETRSIKHAGFDGRQSW